MKRIILLRHAKASWEYPNLKDHDRPLAQKGIKEAGLVGDFLRERSLIPDLVICSTAKRTTKTAEIVLKKIKKNVNVSFDQNLYSGGLGNIMRIISSTPDNIQTLLIVGHNPDMELLVDEFTKEIFPDDKFKTASIAVIDLKSNSWKKIKDSTGSLVLFATQEMMVKEQRTI